MPPVSPIAWLGLGALVVVALAIDLFGHRGDHVDSRGRALAWTGLWIGLAIVFGIGLLIVAGPEAGEEFFAVWLLEKSLSVDNLFVFLVIFDLLQIPRNEQRRVLTWGIFGALITRAIFIGAGAVLLERWHGLAYVFGGVLVITGLKLLRPEGPPGESRVMKLVRRVVPMTGLHGHHFVAKQGGRWLATPLLLALIVVEITDVMFAIDSIPAAFAVSTNTFVIYSANIFAVFGLRSLYIVLASALKELKYLRPGLAAVLLLAGAKMLGSSVFHPPAWASLVAIAVVMGTAVGASLLSRARAHARAAPGERVPPGQPRGATD